MTVAPLTVFCLPASSSGQSESFVEGSRPTLYLVGDSTMKTGIGKGARGMWGWGSLIHECFDSETIQINNAARGGRTTRSYIDEGLWEEIVEQLKPGDFVVIEFGHNEYGNSEDHPDRITLRGSGEETREITSSVTGKGETIHTYGWYLEQYVQQTKAKGAIPIICSPVPRNIWIGGKVDRGFYGYARWAAEAAQASDSLYINLNEIVAGRFDQLGREETAKLFVDYQHTNLAGAKFIAQAVAEGIRELEDCKLGDALVASHVTP